MNASLKATTGANLGYNVACKLLVSALSMATMIVLARNLSADDYGIIGFAMIFIGFLEQFSDFGMTASIIQKETIQENELYTAFTLKILLSLVIFAVSFFWGIISQKAFDNPAVKTVIIVSSTNFFLSSLGFLPTTLLTRALKFKRLTIPQIGAKIAATVIAIVTVYMGFRYWSIVISSLISTIVGVIIVYTLCPVRFKLKWDRDAAKEHLKFGIHMFLAGIMIFVMLNVDNFAIGAIGGAAALGFYSIAFDWSTRANVFLYRAINSVLFSTFSRVQGDIERLKRGYLTILEYVSFGAVLINSLLLILSKELLILVIGNRTEKWVAALVAFQILCVYGIMRAVLEPVGTLIISIGQPALISKSNAIVVALQVAFLYPFLKYFGIAGVAIVVTVSYSVQFLVYFPALHRVMGLNFSAVFRSVRPALISGSVLAFFGFALDRFVHTSSLSLAVKFAVGSSIYLITYGFLTKWKLLQDAKVVCHTMGLRPQSTN